MSLNYLAQILYLVCLIKSSEQYFEDIELFSNALEPILPSFLVLDLKSNDYAKFEHSTSYNFSNMLLDNGWLFFTGTNYVFKLNANNISDRRIEYYKEKSIYPTNKYSLSTPNKSMEFSKKSNYMKFLSLRENNNDLLICGTNLGRPHILDLDQDDLSNIVEFNGAYLCPDEPFSNSLGLISFDKANSRQSYIRKGIMYSAIWSEQSFDEERGPYSMYGIYRKEIEVNGHFLRTLPSPFWLWKPNFIHIIEDANFIYYFFTEISIENVVHETSLKQMNETKLKRYARIARVCKSDNGIQSENHSKLNNVWTSFRKIRMKCQLDQFTFDNLIQIKQLGSKIIAIYLHNHLSISIFCEFELNKLELLLKNKKFWLNRYANSTEINFKFLNNDQIDCKRNHNKDEESEEFFEFLSENTILNVEAEGTFQLLISNKLTCFVVGRSFIYAADQDGQLHKIVTGESGYKIVSIFKIGELINELLLKQNIYLYVATSTRVIQIDLDYLHDKLCNNFENWFVCELNPDCVWHLEANKCKLMQSTRKKITNMYEIKNLTIRSNEKQVISLNCANIDKKKFKYYTKFFKQITWYANGEQITEENENYLIKDNKLLILNLVKSVNFTCQLNKNPNTIQKFTVNLIKEDSSSFKKEELTSLLIDWKKEISNFNKNFKECT